MRGFEQSDARKRRRPSETRAGDGFQLLSLLSLFGFAVTQPVLDLLGRYPQFFVARGATRVEVLCLVAILSVGAPAVAFAAFRLCGGFRTVSGRWFHRALIALGAALFILLALKRIPDVSGGLGWLVVALSGGAVFSLAYARWSPIRLFLRLLSPSPLIFASVFLAGPPMRAFLSDAGTEAARVRVGSPAPVVMVVLDELPLASLLDETGEIDRRRFPHFSELARDADWYRNATTVADSTELSVPAILSGRYPTPFTGRLATSADFPRTLFTLLTDHYDLRVFESATKLCPPSLCAAAQGGRAARLASLALDVSVLYLHLVLPPGLERKLPRVDQTWRGFVRFGGSPVVSELDPLQAFSAFLESIQPDQRPTFSFIHLQLPHAPWVFLPSGKRYLPWKNDYTSPNVWDDQTALVELGFQRHVLQVALADRLLGRLVGRLKELGRYDETLLIVLSDHGASFRPGQDRRAATFGNFRDIAAIPLWIKIPGQRQGRVLDVNAETIDVAPSVADILDIDPAWPADGRSLFSDASSERALKTIFGGSQAAGLVFSPDLSDLAGSVICDDGMPSLKIEQGSLRAHLDSVSLQKDRVLLVGWAGDLENKRIADSILVFADGRLVFRGGTGVHRPDVERVFPGRGLANAGFAFAVGSDYFEGTTEVRVIAVGGGKAAEVRYPKDFPPRRSRSLAMPSPKAACGEDGLNGAGTRLIRVWTDAPEDGRWPPRLVELARTADDAGYFRFPPCGRLVGREVKEPAAHGSPEWTASLDDSAALLRVDPDSGFVPAGVRGTLETTGPPVPRQVAVALDGVIAGLAPTFLSPEGERRFLVPVPETSLRRGANRVALYGVAEEECRLLTIAVAAQEP